MGLKKTTIVHDVIRGDNVEEFVRNLDKAVENKWIKVGGVSSYNGYYCILVEKEITVH